MAADESGREDQADRREDTTDLPLVIDVRALELMDKVDSGIITPREYQLALVNLHTDG